MSVSSMTSRGRSPPTSWPSRSSVDPAFEGPLGELDRRSRRRAARPGRVRRADAASATRPRWRRPASCRRAGSSPSARRGRRARPRDRRSASAPRPSGGSAAGRSTGWRSGSTPLVDASTASAETVAELVARGVVEGSLRPRGRSIARASRSAPPELDELILDRARARTPPALTAAAERGLIIGEGANIARTLSNRASNDVSPEVLADEARGHRRAARPVDRRHRAGAGHRARAWACSWPSAGAATTRRG